MIGLCHPESSRAPPLALRAPLSAPLERAVSRAGDAYGREGVSELERLGASFAERALTEGARVTGAGAGLEGTLCGALGLEGALSLAGAVARELVAGLGRELDPLPPPPEGAGREIEPLPPPPEGAGREEEPPP